MTTEAYSTNKTTDRAKESYDKIVCGIKSMYHNNITHIEADEAARNLIGLCNIIINYKIEQKREKYAQTSNEIL